MEKIPEPAAAIYLPSGVLIPTLNNLLKTEATFSSVMPFANEDAVISACKETTFLGKLVNFCFPAKVQGDSGVTFQRIPEDLEKEESIARAIEAGIAAGCQILDLTSAKILAGNPADILGFASELVILYLTQNINVTSVPGVASLFGEGENAYMPPKEILVRWINYHLKAAGYATVINDIDETLKDSAVMLPLLEKLFPDQIEKAALAETDLAKKAEAVVQCCQKAGSRLAVRPEDILAGNPRIFLGLLAELFNVKNGLESVPPKSEPVTAAITVAVSDAKIEVEVAQVAAEAPKMEATVGIEAVPATAAEAPKEATVKVEIEVAPATNAEAPKIEAKVEVEAAAPAPAAAPQESSVKIEAPAAASPATTKPDDAKPVEAAPAPATPVAPAPAKEDQKEPSPATSPSAKKPTFATNRKKEEDEKTFKNWLVTFLGAPLVEESLYENLRDGLILLKLIEKLWPGSTDPKQYEKTPNGNRFKMIINGNYVVEVCRKQKLVLPGTNGVDIVDCNESKVLGLLWQLMRVSSVAVAGNKSEEELVQWANGILKGKQPEIKSLKEPELKSGQYLINLLAAVQPTAVDFGAVKEGKTDEEADLNAKYVLGVAKDMGIKSALTFEDIKTVPLCLLQFSRRQSKIIGE